MTNPLKVFVSYAHKDKAYLDDFNVHLSQLKRSNQIETWIDEELKAGDEWDADIKSNLETADLIVFLISPHFMASDYIYRVEIAKAFERYDRKEVVIIPVIIRPCEFGETKLAKFQALPKSAKPISKWEDQDEAWLDVAKGVRRVVESMLNENSQNKPTSSNSSNNIPPSSVKPNPPTSSNSNNNIGNKLKELIGKGKVKQVIDKLLDITKDLEDGDLYNSTILLSSRYNSNQKSINSGVISSAEANVQESRIRNSLMALIDELDN